MAKVVKLIQTEERRGTGKQSDPYRSVTQYFSMQGELLWEDDPQEKIKGNVCIQCGFSTKPGAINMMPKNPTPKYTEPCFTCEGIGAPGPCGCPECGRVSK